MSDLQKIMSLLRQNSNNLHCIVLSIVVTPTRKSLEFKHASQ